MNVIYLTNLGVAEMNINELEKSFVKFQKALRIDSSFQLDIDNLDILKNFVKKIR